MMGPAGHLVQHCAPALMPLRNGESSLGPPSYSLGGKWLLLQWGLSGSDLCSPGWSLAPPPLGTPGSKSESLVTLVQSSGPLLGAASILWPPPSGASREHCYPGPPALGPIPG